MSSLTDKPLSWCWDTGFDVVQAYPHASSVIQSLGETDISVNLLVQVDKLVRLLETPIFAYLRLQVIFLPYQFLEPVQDYFFTPCFALFRMLFFP
jgi:hypothetical protein